MNLTDYLQRYAEELDLRPSLRSYLLGIIEHGDGGQLIEGGVLQFTAETAPCWGGPFPGSCAAYRLIDHTKTPFRNKKTLLIEEGTNYRTKYPESPQTMVDRACPIILQFFGNDDTSYSKFYVTVEQGQAELDLFKAAEPLDFHELVVGFAFSFTN